MRRNPAARLCRLAITGLAVTGLLGHGLAMLLVALLATGLARAETLQYGEICTADGSTAAGPPIRENSDGPPRPGESHGNACPVCTAFAHGGLGDLPTPAVLPWTAAGGADWPPAGDAAAPADGRLAAHSRGPPEAA